MPPYISHVPWNHGDDKKNSRREGLFKTQKRETGQDSIENKCHKQAQKIGIIKKDDY